MVGKYCILARYIANSSKKREITRNIDKNSSIPFFQLYNVQISKSACIKITGVEQFKEKLRLILRLHCSGLGEYIGNMRFVLTRIDQGLAC